MGQRYALGVQLVETSQAEDEGEEALIRPCRIVRESSQAGPVLRRDQGDPLRLSIALDVTTATLPETLVTHGNKTRNFLVSGEEVEAESGALHRPGLGPGLGQ